MLSQEVLSDIDLMIPDDQLQSEVEKQFTLSEPIHTFNKNFLEVFFKRQLLKNEQRESEDDEDDPDSIENNTTDIEWFYRYVILNLKERCGILIDTESQVFDPPIINTIYSMFIFRLHMNMINYIAMSILNNKEYFANRFLSSIQNSVTFKSAKKTFKNKTDAIIAVKYSDIIDLILQEDQYINPEGIIQVLYQSNPEDYEYITINNLYQIVYLSFDIPKFIQFIRFAYLEASAISNLKNNIMQRLLASFPVKPVSEEEEGEDT